MVGSCPVGRKTEGLRKDAQPSVAEAFLFLGHEALLNDGALKVTSSSKRFHIDGRASALADDPIGADPDRLLDTHAVARWFDVSEHWLEIGRSKHWGPKYVKLGPRMFRYRVRDCLDYLEDRIRASTAEYSEREEAVA